MTNGSQENAMTEIALAMAMGFFSIMVLTALSMGVSRVPITNIDTAILTKSASTDGQSDKVGPSDILVIYDGKTFYDRQLKPLDPATLPPGQRQILAVGPNLPVSETISAQQRLTGENVVVTTLDRKWRQALEARGYAK